MPVRAKLFQNGESQAVRLPKGYHFPEGESEVVVRREGRRVIVELPDEWPTSFRACLGAWPSAIERPKQRPLTTLKG